MTIPKAFISYSHDSLAHKQWVLEFATRLRNSGIDAILDQWELQPGDDLPSFMEKQLVSADRVLMICTEQYVKKANAGTGGVGYEKMIVTSDLMRSIDTKKVIPIIRQSGSRCVPTFLESKKYIDFSNEAEIEYSYDEVVRALVGAPLFKKPQIGNNPFKPVAETPIERSADAVRDLMQLLVTMFERTHHNFILYADVVSTSKVSRILLDLTIQEALDRGLIKIDRDGDLYITDDGKHYAVLHKLYRA
jgi:hypothetical protein